MTPPMPRLATLLVTVALLAAPLALASPDGSTDPYDVQVHPASHTLLPGNSTRSDVILTANVSVTATLNVTAIPVGITARLDRTTLTADAGNSTNTSLKIGVSSNATPGTYWIEITTAQHNGTHVEIDHVQVRVQSPPPPPPQAQLSLSPGLVEVDAGETARFNLTCSANANLTLWLSHNPPPAGWNVSLSRYVCHVSPGHNDTVRIDVRTSANATGEWTLDVHGYAGSIHANDTAVVRIAPPPLVETRTCVLGACIETAVPRPGVI